MQHTEIIKAIEAHASEFGLEASTICQMSVRNSRLYRNLKDGSDIQFGTAKKLLDWLAEDAAKRSQKRHEKSRAGAS